MYSLTGLNIGSRPISNRYHEGNVERTLNRELKVPEIAEREANGTDNNNNDDNNKMNNNNDNDNNTNNNE